MRLMGENEMKRCVVRFNKNEFCNIEATMLCREDSVVFVYNGTELVGVFDLGYVDAIYLAEKKGYAES